MTSIIKIFILLFFISINANSQNLPFFIELKNQDLGENYYQSIPFCTNLNDKEIIYIKNYYSPDFPKFLDYSSKLIKSNKNGEVVKIVDLGDANNKVISSYGFKINEKNIVISFDHSADSFYINVRKVDENLNFSENTRHSIASFSPNIINKVNLFTEMHSCKDTQGNLYIVVSTDLKIFGLAFNNTADLITYKVLNTSVGIHEQDGFMFDVATESLVYYIEDRIKYTFDKKFNIKQTINLFNDNDVFSPYDTSSGLWSSLLNIGDQVVRFGRISFTYNNFEQDSFTEVQGRALSYVDQNGSIKGKVNFTPFPMDPESEGIPRLSGGLFYRDGYFYTFFEFSSTGFPFKNGNTTYITKYDENFDIVEETSFVFDPNYRLFTYWVELTDDNSFIGSGFYYNVDPENGGPFVNGGGFVFGLTADGRPPNLSSDNPMIKAIFTVKGNPTSDQLVIETDSQKAKGYNVLILDINGRIIRSSTSWHQGRIEIDVADQKSGTYFYQILEKGQTVTGGKFVKI